MAQRFEQIQRRELGRQTEAVAHIALAFRQHRIVEP